MGLKFGPTIKLGGVIDGEHLRGPLLRTGAE